MSAACTVCLADDYGGPYRELFTQIATDATAAIHASNLTATSNLSSRYSTESTLECAYPLLKKAVQQADSAGEGFATAESFTVAEEAPQYYTLATESTAVARFFGQVLGKKIVC